MTEIGYWKYIRFVDDEKQYFGTDDDITIVFDSTDDRLEYRMNKDIRFEDDAGNEILTLDKVNRHVEIPVQLKADTIAEYTSGAGVTADGVLLKDGVIPNSAYPNAVLLDGTRKMTGNLEIEKSIPAIVLDDTAPVGSKAPFILFAGAARWQYRDSDDTLRLEDAAVGAVRFKIERTTGNITRVGNIDMGGSLLKNAKLGTSLDFNDYDTSKIGMLECKERATPTTPAAGYGRIYFKTDGRLYYLNDAGVEYGPL